MTKRLCVKITQESKKKNYCLYIIQVALLTHAYSTMLTSIYKVQVLRSKLQNNRIIEKNTWRLMSLTTQRKKISKNWLIPMHTNHETNVKLTYNSVLLSYVRSVSGWIRITSYVWFIRLARNSYRKMNYINSLHPLCEDEDVQPSA
jgi:hypothetical protein